MADESLAFKGETECMEVEHDLGECSLWWIQLHIILS